MPLKLSELTRNFWTNLYLILNQVRSSLSKLASVSLQAQGVFFSLLYTVKESCFFWSCLPRDLAIKQNLYSSTDRPMTRPRLSHSKKLGLWWIVVITRWLFASQMSKTMEKKFRRCLFSWIVSLLAELTLNRPSRTSSPIEAHCSHYWISALRKEDLDPNPTRSGG